MKNENIKDIIAENRRRTARLADNYDPISGRAMPRRANHRQAPRRQGRACASHHDRRPQYRKQMSAHDFNQIRQRHDFEYWCTTCVTVKDKSGYADVRLRLNRPQRIIAGILERQRTANQPIRAILLKARQARRFHRCSSLHGMAPGSFTATTGTASSAPTSKTPPRPSAA